MNPGSRSEGGGARARATDPVSPSPRVVRVFVSSTFRDMEAERDELAKRAFPRLRSLCESRGVTWGEVDLRWGITDEQRAEGKVLPICLAEIRRCRPYFIGLLGERYGTVPEEISLAASKEEPWLGELRGRSVTEIEMLYGALNAPEMAEHAFFYLRSPDYLTSLPADLQSAFRELPAPGDIERSGIEEAGGRAVERAKKLATLKERIRNSGLPVRDNYPDPRALGDMVLADLSSVIDGVFPEGSVPDRLDREAAEHEAFAQSRSRVYIGRPEYFDRLDRHARGDGRPLVVLGESGSGKSALLANWARRYRVAHPEDLLVQHFIGATPASADWAAMVRRVLGELKRRFGFKLEVPEEADALRPAFAKGLRMAAARGRVVLVLDALNQLEDRDGAPDLIWLPPVVPETVRLVLSTLPGRPLEELSRRDWPSLRVKPLTSDERKRLANEYLAQYAKSLSPGHVARIAAARQAANPLYLRALLEELRLWHEHETLEGRIEHYLLAASPEELFQKVLERYETDYERERPDLVRDAMSLLWAARRGLSEAELLDLLGREGNALPTALWSPLYLASEQALVDRSGLLGFAHDHLRQAVTNRYLSDASRRRSAHLRIAGYFQKRDTGARVVEELPWQLARAGRFDRLYRLLTRLPFFRAAWDADKYEVMRYWTLVEEQTAHRLGMRAYEDLTAGLDAIHVDDLANWSSLLDGKGLLRDALPIEALLVSHHSQQEDQEQYAYALNNLAETYRRLGDLEKAMEMQKEVERIFRERGDEDGVAISLGNQALIAESRGQLNEASDLLARAQATWRAIGNKDDLARALNNQAEVLRVSGRVDEALTLQGEVEQILREEGDTEGLAASLENQALTLIALHRYREGRSLLRQAEEIYRQIGNTRALAQTLCNQGMLEAQTGNLDDAMKLLGRCEELARDLDMDKLLVSDLFAQALALAKANRPEEALRLAEDAFGRAKEMGDDLMCARIGDTLRLFRSRDRGEGPDIENLARRLRDPDSGIRAEAAKALGGTGDAKAAKALIQALKDPDAMVMGVAAASLALLALQDPSVEKLLTRSVKDRDEDVRWGARTALDGLEQLKARRG